MSTSSNRRTSGNVTDSYVSIGETNSGGSANSNSSGWICGSNTNIIRTITDNPGCITGTNDELIIA